jgi:hypothetical protein
LAFRRRLLGLALLALAALPTLYVVLMTYSRATVVALAVAALGFVFAVMVAPRRGRLAVGFAAATLAVLLAGLVIGRLMGAYQLPLPFFEKRFAAVEQDFRIRLAHWTKSLAARDDDILTAAIGMGLGSFPRVFAAQADQGERSGYYRLVAEDGNSYLRLLPGRSMFFNQRIWPDPAARYRLSFDMRVAADRRIAPAVFVCEKALLYSFRCFTRQVELRNLSGGWERYDIDIPMDGMGAARDPTGWLSKRAVVFSVYGGDRAPVDFDNMRLVDEAGRDLVANGDFQDGVARWYATTGAHLPWHAKNLWVHFVIEQGWFGALALSLVSLVALGRCLGAARQGDRFAAAPFAAIIGFLIVGLFGSLFDAPRLILLFLMIVTLAMLMGRTPPAQPMRR